jgi:hypothetical protein
MVGGASISDTVRKPSIGDKDKGIAPPHGGDKGSAAQVLALERELYDMQIKVVRNCG